MGSFLQYSLSCFRWTVRAETLSIFIKSYRELRKLFTQSIESGGLDSSTRARMIGCLSQMKDSGFLYGIS